MMSGTDEETVGTDEETARHKAMIERDAKQVGMTTPDGWVTNEDGRVEAGFGGWRVIDDNEDRGLFAGDEGTLAASVVGGIEYGNERVCWSFTPPGMDYGEEVTPFEDIEPV